MFVLLLYTYLCMYLPQAIPLPLSAGIEWDLFRHIQQAEEVELEPAVVTCSVVAHGFSAVPLPSRHVYRGKTGPFLSRIGLNRCHCAIGGGPWRRESSAPRGKGLAFLVLEILTNLCTCCLCIHIYVCTCRKPYRSRY